MCRRATVLLGLCAAMPVSAPAADWPTYAHDNRRSGVTAERLAPPLALRWVFRPAFPPARGWARPVNGYGATKNASNVRYDDACRVVAVGDTAYFASSGEDLVYAVDASTGAIRWTFHTGGPPRLAPTVRRGRVYFGSDAGTAWCLKADDGSVVWKYRCAPTGEKMLGTRRWVSLWPMRTGVMVEGSVAYFTAGLFPSEGVYLHAVDAGTGRRIWRRQLDSGGVGCPSPQGDLLASGDSLYIPSRTAPTRWRLADGAPQPFATPLPRHEYRFHNGGSYAQIWDGKIVYGQAAILGYDPDKAWTDKYKREQKGALAFHWFNARRIAFSGDCAYVATDYHLLGVKHARLAALSAAECTAFEEAYRRHRVADYLTALEEMAEHGEDSPVGRRLKETSLKWGRKQFDAWPAAAEKLFARFAARCEWMLPVNATEAMAIAGDVLYAGGEGFVVGVDLRTGRELWRDETRSRVRGLAVANGRLFVSTIDGAVRCYAAGPAGKPPAAVRAAAAFAQPAERAPDGALAKVVADVAARMGQRKGYGLVCGGDGRLARAIARDTKLAVHVLVPDAAKVAGMRRELAAAGLYGGRVTVERAERGAPPLPPYVFNAVIDAPAVAGGTPFAAADDLLRLVRPCGGAAYVGPLPAGRVVRGPLAGAANWTHNYATAANTYCSGDTRVRGPFGILWYGRPGPRDRIDRHATPPVPLVVDGRMFLTGYHRVMCYDVYNGVLHWRRTLLDVARTGLPIGTSNLVADRDGLFLVVADRQCLHLDPATGRTLRTFAAPPRAGAEPPYWGWIAKVGGLLYGSRALADERRRRADPKRSDAVFALDARTGRTRWVHEGGPVDHDGIAVGGGTMFLVDGDLTDAERREALAATGKDAAVPDRPAADRRGKPVPPDLRMIVALDAATGRVRWQRPFNATDITRDDTVVSAGRVGVACMVADGVVVVHGTASLGHPYKEFLQGEFQRRALYAYDAGTGKRLWGGRRNYRKRPIIVGDHVYAEPHAWQLRTGKPRTYVHPLSGRDEPTNIFRGYIGCSHLLGSGAALFGNRNGIAHLNLDERSGYTPFGNMALGCGLCAVPAGGVFVAPEGRSGCTCATGVHASIALYPRQEARTWGEGIPGGFRDPAVLPVTHAAVNLGAPGFRESPGGTLWVPYPYREGKGLIGTWLPAYDHKPEMFYRHSGDYCRIEGTDVPWVFTSGYAHTKPLRFELIGKGQPPASYTVRLFFAEPEDLEPGARVFSVRLQETEALTGFDIVREAGGARKAVVKVFRGVTVRDALTVTLTPDGGAAPGARPPILCGIEARKE